MSIATESPGHPKRERELWETVEQFTAAYAA
jgi:hypothetical protein